jgi:hypothetical protein
MPDSPNNNTKPRWKILDKRRFLIAAMEELAGDAHISFEGNLSGTRISSLSHASTEETLALKRNTLWPKQEFIVLPLQADSIKAISSAIGGTIPKAILHIQIEKNGCLEVGLYDNFTPSATFLGSKSSEQFIERLQMQGIIRQSNS